MGSNESSTPLKPFWQQPSHPDIQEVIINNEKDFTTKSISRIDVKPHGIFAELEFPPCTKADFPTYATVQMGKNSHLNLNSDLVYINHSCDPSVNFDMTKMAILAGPNGLKAGEELTFFYPSTEWAMAQGFDCFCNSQSCCGYISGARDMSTQQLEGKWLNTHIVELLEEQQTQRQRSEVLDGHVNGSGAKEKSGAVRENGVGSRELSGEMGGDTSS